MMRAGGRAEAIELYRVHLQTSLALKSDIWELRGQMLACHCTPEVGCLGCHADILICEFIARCPSGRAI
eukprot:12033551-Heterocapsa_arctica.AAC.1